MIKCYELITVQVKGETVLARPVAWDREIYDGEGNDAKGDPANPTEYQASCPHCGNLIHFSNDDIYEGITGADNVKCEECGAHAKKADVEDDPDTTSAIEPKEVTFLDPIADGLFDLDVDLDLLKELDSTELG